MALVYTFGNQKGGVGKSTCTQNLAGYLINKDKKILVIDMDPQYNISTLFDAVTEETDSNQLNIMHVLIKKCDIHEAIQHINNIDVISSSLYLANIDQYSDSVNRPYLLQDALKLVHDEYDYILIDAPPALGTVTLNCLIASNYIIIPANAESLSIQGIKQIYSTIQTVQNRPNPNLKIAGILLNKLRKNTKLAKNLVPIYEEMASMIDCKLFNSKIRDSQDIQSAQGMCQTIYEYAPKSNAVDDFNLAGKEIFGI